MARYVGSRMEQRARQRPDDAIERGLRGLVAGVDEAGRGPLAGPVVAAAAVLPLDGLPPALAAEIRDSKQLAPARRRALYPAIRRHAAIGVGAASVAEIETVNILAATMRAMARAVAALPLRPSVALVDGNRAPDLPCRVETLVGGDARSLSIAAASIVAKVTRDRIMARLAVRYPGFGWERNSGYGTAAHRSALRSLGITRHHRRTFAPVRACLTAVDSRSSPPPRKR